MLHQFTEAGEYVLRAQMTGSGGGGMPDYPLRVVAGPLSPPHCEMLWPEYATAGRQSDHRHATRSLTRTRTLTPTRTRTRTRTLTLTLTLTRTLTRRAGYYANWPVRFAVVPFDGFGNRKADAGRSSVFVARIQGPRQAAAAQH